jgi:hypothetical protein
MKSTDQVGITFVNAVLGRGILNGVANLTLGVFAFDPTGDGKISENLTVACRLRMDVNCAKMIRDQLDELLTAIEKPGAGTTTGIAANGDASHASEGKPN